MHPSPENLSWKLPVHIQIEVARAQVLVSRVGLNIIVFYATGEFKECIGDGYKVEKYDQSQVRYSLIHGIFNSAFVSKARLRPKTHTQEAQRELPNYTSLLRAFPTFSVLPGI